MPSIIVKVSKSHRRAGMAAENEHDRGDYERASSAHGGTNEIFWRRKYIGYYECFVNGEIIVDVQKYRGNCDYLHVLVKGFDTTSAICTIIIILMSNCDEYVSRGYIGHGL